MACSRAHEAPCRITLGCGRRKGGRFCVVAAWASTLLSHTSAHLRARALSVMRLLTVCLLLSACILQGCDLVAVCDAPPEPVAFTNGAKLPDRLALAVSETESVDVSEAYYIADLSHRRSGCPEQNVRPWMVDSLHAQPPGIASAAVDSLGHLRVEALTSGEATVNLYLRATLEYGWRSPETFTALYVLQVEVSD